MNTHERVAALLVLSGLPIEPKSVYCKARNQRYGTYTAHLVRYLEHEHGLESQGYLGDRVDRLERHIQGPLNYRSQIVLFDGHYSPSLCQDYPGLTFVFGDNSLRTGMGGQACIRGQRNTIGVVTKRKPGGANEFFEDGDVSDMSRVCLDLGAIDVLLRSGNRIVLPITPEGRISLGCGLAQLPYHAPLIYAFIERWFNRTIAAYTTTKG